MCLPPLVKAPFAEQLKKVVYAGICEYPSYTTGMGLCFGLGIFLLLQD